MRSVKVRQATLLLLWIFCFCSGLPAAGGVRAPAVPLVTHDPYFSIWSMSDRLTDGATKHWTGTNHALTGLVRIDGQAFRVIGDEPKSVSALEQTALEVTPTRSGYVFQGGGVEVRLDFLSPVLADDLELVSRPASYITWAVRSLDQKPHAVSLYFDCSPELAVNSRDQKVVWGRLRLPGMDVLTAGNPDQPVLGRSGDNLRIDWGFLYLAQPKSNGTDTALAPAAATRARFLQEGKLPESDDLRMPRAVSDQPLVLASTFELGTVAAQAVRRHLILAYDDQYSIEYFQRKLRPYWARNGAKAHDLLLSAEKEYESLQARCLEFDRLLVSRLNAAGGEPFVQLATLAYRQCLAAHKLVVDVDGTPLYFSKENFSNGCIGTVDVTYPSAPFFLVFNPELLKAMLTPVLDYASLPRWKFPFAPHDLGQYPLANGQVYGGKEQSEENQMPVEESGNMLLLVAALAKVEGNADYAQGYWPLISRWALYLREKGMDPENQLCTDDFAGHLAHNTNLSIKAIEALGAYSLLCSMSGRDKDAVEYRVLAGEMAKTWMTKADDGDHYRLAFDKPGTWSQKYNLVWDQLLGLNLFPEEVARRELEYYLSKQNTYGLPLDNRSEYTKLDWIVWTASLSGSREQFNQLILPLQRFLQETPDRVPMTDWYWTHDGKKRGFQARSVVGGVFIPLVPKPLGPGK